MQPGYRLGLTAAAAASTIYHGSEAKEEGSKHAP